MIDLRLTLMRARAASVARGRWLVGTCLMVAGALSACTDGYPTSDASPLTAAQMNRPQRLAQLRQLGEAGHQAFTWRYQFHDDCRLAVVGRGPGRADDRWEASLRGAVLDIDFDEARKAYDVGILPKASEGHPRHVVYRADKWTDAIFVMALFQQIQRDCSAWRQLETERHAET